MGKVSHIPLENILADDLLSRKSRKGWIFDRRGTCQFTFLINFSINCAWTTYPGNASLVETQCCRSARELQAVDEQWAVTARIANQKYLYIGLPTWCFMEYVKIVYFNHRQCVMRPCETLVLPCTLLCDQPQLHPSSNKCHFRVAWFCVITSVQCFKGMVAFTLGTKSSLAVFKTSRVQISNNCV